MLRSTLLLRFRNLPTAEVQSLFILEYASIQRSAIAKRYEEDRTVTLL